MSDLIFISSGFVTGYVIMFFRQCRYISVVVLPDGAGSHIIIMCTSFSAEVGRHLSPFLRLPLQYRRGDLMGTEPVFGPCYYLV